KDGASFTRNRLFGGRGKNSQEKCAKPHCQTLLTGVAQNFSQCGAGANSRLRLRREAAAGHSNFNSKARL
ncbi:MAG TPA: hypothetical protein VHH73_20385, partial [Verrucomicrobiae bacterium]|nr:hypothetical protein [Verrucomicrobiae bacterium]